MKRRPILVCIVLIVLFANIASAYSSYRAEIPNGHNVFRNGLWWPGVGHSTASDGPINIFGVQFAAAGHRWTGAFCQADSDGDGYTNGQELGDPDCVWRAASIPSRGTDISHPGYADSIPTTIAGPARTPSSNATPSPPIQALTPSPSDNDDDDASPTPAPATPSPVAKNFQAQFMAEGISDLFTEASFQQMMAAELSGAPGIGTVSPSDIIVTQVTHNIDTDVTVMLFTIRARDEAEASAITARVATIPSAKLTTVGVSAVRSYEEANNAENPKAKPNIGFFIAISLCAMLLHPFVFGFVATRRLCKPLEDGEGEQRADPTRQKQKKRLDKVRRVWEVESGDVEMSEEPRSKTYEQKPPKNKNGKGPQKESGNLPNPVRRNDLIGKGRNQKKSNGKK